VNLGILLNLTHLDPAAQLNMTLTISRGTGEPWDTAESTHLNMTLPRSRDTGEPDSPGSRGTAEPDSPGSRGTAELAITARLKSKTAFINILKRIN
jgi:hypothetical protein